MEDTKKTTQSAETPAVDTKEETNKGGKNFTQEEVDKIVAKRLNEANAKSQEATDVAIKKALEEYDRQAKLTAEEREKEAKSKRESELKAREDNVTLRERTIQAKEMLDEKGIPTEVVDFLIDLDENKTKENVEQFTKLYNKSVEIGVTNKLKGNPPTDFSNVNNNQEGNKTKYSGTVAF